MHHWECDRSDVVEEIAKKYLKIKDLFVDDGDLVDVTVDLQSIESALEAAFERGANFGIAGVNGRYRR